MTGTAQKEPLTDENEVILTNSLITREELDEFKAIAFKEYGLKLTDKQAFEQATALLNLFDTLIDKRVEFMKKGVNISR